MTFLDTLERRFGHLAIPGLVRIVALLNLLVYFIGAVDPKTVELLAFNREAIFADGQYWRIISFLFIPRTTSPLFLLIAVWFLWSISGAIEIVWGTFKLNLYYLIGSLLTILSAIFFGPSYSNAALNLSLLFIYARFFPDVMMLFPPIPMKWAAWIFGGFAALGLFSPDPSYRGAVFAMAITYLLFFGPETLRNMRQRETAARRKKKYEESAVPVDQALHRCATCGRTELTHPQLDFRVSRDGHEYCTEHLPRPAAS